MLKIRACYPLVLLLSLPGGVSAEGIREVRYTDKSSVQITSQQRFGTVIVLPKEDAIVDALCGDKEYWIVDEVKNAPNAVSVKPARAGAASNLHLVAASGRIYTFGLHEGTAKADDKVFVIPDDATFTNTARRYHSDEEMDALRNELVETRAAVAKARTEATDEATRTIDTFRSQYPMRMRFDYAYTPPPSAFGVRAVWHDERFTYIDLATRTLPILYEEQDGKPRVSDYQVQGGHLYVVPHVVEQGYLQSGSKKWPFRLMHD